MLRHKEPIFSRSTGRWPPETGPVAQQHRQQTIPRHRCQYQPREGQWELTSPAEKRQIGRGSLGFPRAHCRAGGCAAGATQVP